MIPSGEIIQVNDSLEYAVGISSKNIHFNRLGFPTQEITFLELLESVKVLSQRITSTFMIVDGRLELMDSFLVFEEEIKNINLEVISVYYTAKLTSSKGSTMKADDCSILKSFFESLLKIYSTSSSNYEDDLDEKSTFMLILSLGLLLSALSSFLDQDAQDESDLALILIITITPLKLIVESFSQIMPPAYKSRLFSLTLYRDLQRIEEIIQTTAKEDLEQLSKIKMITEMAFYRFGNYFLISYSDEILSAFNQKHLIACPKVLWKKVTFGSDTVKTDLGPSFLVNMSKLQWGILKDYNAIVPDPSTNSLYFHLNLDKLFHFQSDQVQQLFILNSSLYTLLKEDQGYQATFNTDADTLKTIYLQLMDHTVRLLTALQDNYTIEPQEPNSNIKLSRLEKAKLLQSAKLHILFLTLNLCIVQLILTETLNIHSAPSISPIIEHYLMKSNFSCTIDNCNIIPEFQEQFKIHSEALITNYSMIKKLSNSVLSFFKGEQEDSGFLNLGLTWNSICYCLILVIILLIELKMIIDTLIRLSDELFLF